MNTQPDPFDDAIARMQNAHSTARAALRAIDEAYIDADAALTVSLQALREATAVHGSVSQQLAEMRETIARLEALVLDQSRQLVEQGQQLRDLHRRNGST